MVVGSVLAIVQTDVKRMLAYSSINHAGFILVAVQAASDAGRRRRRSSTSAAYTFMVAGSFGVIAVVSRKGDVGNSLDDYRGPVPRPPGAGLRLRGVPLRPGRRAAHVRASSPSST